MGELIAGDEDLFEAVKGDEFIGGEDDLFSAFTACSECVERCGQSRRAGDVVAVEVYKSEERFESRNVAGTGQVDRTRSLAKSGATPEA